MQSAALEWTTVEDWLGADWPGKLFLRRELDRHGRAHFEARAVIDSSAGMVKHKILVFSAVGLGETSVEALRHCWAESAVTMQRLARERLLSERGREWLDELLAPAYRSRAPEFAAPV